jgi:hypothetical protein
VFHPWLEKLFDSIAACADFWRGIDLYACEMDTEFPISIILRVLCASVFPFSSSVFAPWLKAFAHFRMFHVFRGCSGGGREKGMREEPGRLRGSARLSFHLVGLPGKPAGVRGKGGVAGSIGRLGRTGTEDGTEKCRAEK